MKNIAGNDVSIFLFRFELRGDGVDFVLNGGIAEDMYQDVDEKLKPLVHACSETLLRYKRLSVSNIIMDGSFLAEGGFEVMLSKGLGRHFQPDEKDRLFRDAKIISDLLAEVMDRRTQELKDGKQPSSSRVDPSKSRNHKRRLGRTWQKKTSTGKIGIARRGMETTTGVKAVASRGFATWCYRIKRIRP